MVKPEDIIKMIEAYIINAYRWAAETKVASEKEAFVRDAECYEEIQDMIRDMMADERSKSNG